MNDPPVAFIVVLLSAVIVTLMAVAVFMGAVWDSSSEIMIAAWAVLIWQALINMVGVVAMINLQSGPVLSRCFNPCCCGSCSWAPGKGFISGMNVLAPISRVSISWILTSQMVDQM